MLQNRVGRLYHRRAQFANLNPVTWKLVTKGNVLLKKEISQSVSILVERRPSASKWADWTWKPCRIIEGEAAAEPFSLIGETGDGGQLFFAGSADIVLHRKETDAYRLNLNGDRVLYIVLGSDDGADTPWVLQAVTASPFEAQDHLDSGDGIVEALPMPPSLLKLLEAFCAVHHKDEPFIKRKRDRVKVEELKFGKEPIFARSGRYPSPGDGDDG